MSTPTPHPTDAVLVDFVLSRLPEPEDAEVESHVDGCAHCQSRAAAAQPEDTLISLLAAAATRTDTVPPVSEATPADFDQTRVWVGERPLGLPAPSASGPAADLSGGNGMPPKGLADHPRYRLVRRLGVGGMGDVWLAEHAVMGRAVALKVIRPEFLARPGAIERFHREVRAVAALHHPNIVTAFDADEAGGTHFLVMEYVPGETLADALKRGPLTPADACRAIRDAARGLAHAHAAGLIHRDVKPSNLIRATDGTVKVLDFGLVGAGSDAVELTGANVVMGTPDYISPEQATDARTADARSDVYSLGCTLYHLLAGRVPFPGDTTLQKLDAHRDPARMPEPVAGVSVKLARVLTRMTAKAPAARYQTATAVADALDQFCVTPDEEQPTVALPGPPRSRRRLTVAAGLVFALVAVAAGVVYKIERDNQIVTVDTDDPEIEVVMRRNGELVRITDTKTKQTWELDTKKMRLKPDGSELSIDLPGKDPLVIRRNGDVAVTIKREVLPIPPAVAAVTPSFEEGRGDGVLRVFGLTARFAPIQLQTEAHINTLAISPDGSRALAGGDDGKVFVWDTATGRTTMRFPERHLEFVRHVAWSLDGRRAISGDSKGGVVVWDAVEGKALHVFRASNVSLVVGVGFFPDGNRMWACRQNRLTVWDVKSGNEALTIDPPSGTPFHRAALSPLGDRFLTADNGAVRLWNAASGAPGLKLESGYNSWVGQVTFAPDGKRVASGDNGGRVFVWDLAGGTREWSVKAHPDAVHWLAFTPDGQRLVTAPNAAYRGNNPIKVWAADGRPIGDLARLSNTHDRILTRDGRMLAGDGKGVVQVYELPELPKKP